MFFPIVAIALVAASVAAVPLPRVTAAGVAKRATSVTATSTSQTVTGTATPTYVTIVSLIGKSSAITLDPSGSTTVFAKATYTVAAPKPTETPAATDDEEPKNEELPSEERRRWIPRGGKEARDIVKRKHHGNHKGSKGVVTIISEMNGPAITLATPKATGTTTTTFGSTLYTIQTGAPTSTATKTATAEPTGTAEPTDVGETGSPDATGTNEPTATSTGDEPTGTAEPTDVEETATKDATATAAVEPTGTSTGVEPTSTSDDNEGVSEERRSYVPRGGNQARDIIRLSKKKNAASSNRLLAQTFLTVATGSLIGALFML